MTLSSASKRWVLLVTLLVYLGRGRGGGGKEGGRDTINKKLGMFAPDDETPYPAVIKASPGSFSKHDFSADRSISSWGKSGGT
jgi:hypothetical protein